MTDDAAPPEDQAPLRPSQRRRRLFRWLAIGAAGVLALVVLAGLTVRYAVLTPPGRQFIASRLEGLSLGPIGRLHVEGLDGDLWRDFSLKRLAIVDARGAWVDARGVRVRWSWPALLARRVQVDALAADHILLARAPVMGPSAPGPSGPMPVSVVLDVVRFRLETLPAISVQRGLFQVAGRLDIERSGGLGGEVHGRSLLHPGDGLDSRFNLGMGKKLLVDAQVREAKGGAIAGLAGLPADRAFYLDAHAVGAPDRGAIHVKALSGAESLAQVDGGWTPAGGAGGGRISLAASRWTSGWMHQFGPEVRLTGRGRGLGADRYDLTLQAGSENAALSVAGMVDAGAQSWPKGLKTQASVTDLSRILSTPAMGRGTVAATLTGRMGNWRLAGDLAVEKLSYGGYGLGRVAGPAELAYAKGEWRLKANLAGAGGQGQGLVAALAGAAPHAVLDGGLLADGRYLIRSLKAEGAGLKLDMTGQRTLFGALEFKGEAQFSNLAAAYAGARGKIGARWSAAQKRYDGAWAFSVDAAGDGLATGQAELDRLLGPKPTLAIAASYDQGATGVSKASLVGAEANLSTSGQIGKAGELKLALDWAAKGPFVAGPLEIAGQAKGGGAVGGTLALPHADLLADFERIQLPQLTLKPAHMALTLSRTESGVEGLINLAAGSDYGPAHGKAALHLVGDGLSLTEIDAAAGGASVAGALALRGASPSSADLNIAVGPGAFIAQGRAQGHLGLVDQPGGAVADLKLTADNVVARNSSMTITRARFAANGPLARLPYTLSAVTVDQAWPVKLDGSGVISKAGQGYAATFGGAGKVRHADFRTLSPATIGFDGPRRSARLDLAVGGGHAEISADQTDQTMAAKAALTGVDLDALGENLAGKVTANLALNGAGADLNGTLDAQLKGARSSDAPNKLGLDGSIHAALAGAKINVDAQVNGASSGDKATVSVVLPAETSAAPFRIAIARTRPIEGRFDANGELQPIWDLFFGGEQSLGGAMNAHGAIGGTFDSPRLTGHATLASGRFEDAGTGLKLRNLAADIDLSETQVDVQRFSGTDAKAGTVSGAGRFSLAAGGESTLTLDVKGFQLLDNDNAKASATGAVTVTRAADGKFKLAGALKIDQALISASTRTPPGVVTMDVVERNRPTGQGEGIAAPVSGQGPDITLDIKLRAPQRILVRGLGLNAELSLDAQVGGTLADPQLSGVARVVRGDYDFAGKRFEIDDQGAIYLATSPDRIRLDLSASWQTTSLTAVIKIKGTAANPTISLTSTPVLPQDEVLSQVLFGSSAAQLSPVQAAQLAAAVTTLATGGGFDVMGGLSRFARLDRLALGGTDATGVTVSGGKYIGSHLYLELTGGGRYGPSAQVEYRASRAFSVISQVGGLGGAKLSVRWRHDYGKVTGIGAQKAKPKR